MRTVPRLHRWLRRELDRSSLRPIGLVVFAASAALLVQLETRSFGMLRAPAVARADAIEHPALVTSFVEEVFVRPGERVAAGVPLVAFSPRFVDRELSRVEAEIAQTLRETRLAEARLRVDEESWLEPGLRRRPGRPSLRSETEAFYDSQLESLHQRRDQLRRAGLRHPNRSPRRPP